MSLENQIEKNTVAVEALTKAIEAQTALISRGVAIANGATPAKAAEKPADKPAEKPAKAAAKSAPKAPTEEDVRTAYGAYLNSTTDKAERKALIETVKPILDHFGADKVTSIPAENRVEALSFCKTLQDAFNEGGVAAAEEVRFHFMQDDGGEEGGEEDGSLL